MESETNTSSQEKMQKAREIEVRINESDAENQLLWKQFESLIIESYFINKQKEYLQKVLNDCKQ